MPTTVMGNSPTRNYPVGLLCVGYIVPLLGDIRRLMRIFLPGLCIWHGFGWFIRPSNLLDNPPTMHTRLMYRFLCKLGSTVRNLIGGIFFAITLRRVHTMFCPILGLYIDILYPLASHCAAVNRLYGSRNHISGLNIRH